VEVELTSMVRVWALVRDYRVALPRLLTEHFSDYGVQERGEGAGTVIAYRLQVERHRAEPVVALHGARSRSPATGHASCSRASPPSSKRHRPRDDLSTRAPR
jgi:hypothetical protein